MTILFAGGEDTSFTLVGTAVASTNATLYRTTFSRIGMLIPNPSATDPPANRIVCPAFTPQSTLWVHAQVNNSLGNATTNNNQSIILRSPDGVGRVYIRQTATAGTLKASIANAARGFTDLATATATFAANTQYALDLKVDYGGTASDQIQLYLNGSLIINYTGASIRTDSATQLNQLELSQIGVSQSTGWSEVIVADVDTRGMALWTLAPVAAGASQAWTPNTVGNINETIINDTTLISSTVNNDLSEWTTPIAAPSGSWTVNAIVQTARVQRGVTGPQHFDWVVRTASADYAAGISQAPGTNFSNFQQIWSTNPSTLAAWSIGNISTGFNLGIKSLA